VCDASLESLVALVESDGARAMSGRFPMPSPQKFSFLGIAGLWMFMLGSMACEVGRCGLIVQFFRSCSPQQDLAAGSLDFGAVEDLVSADGGIARGNEDEAVAAADLLEGAAA
jgi:hypothetical protein